MKNVVMFVSTMLISLVGISQVWSFDECLDCSDTKLISSTFAVHTPEKDTLWFLEGNSMAEHIYQKSWVDDISYKGPWPGAILFVSFEQFQAIEKRIKKLSK